MSDNETNINKVAELEALLFYHGEPITIKKTSKLLGLNEEQVKETLERLRILLVGDPVRGLTLLERGDEVQLVTKASLQGVGKKLIEEEFREELTPAALETLSIIAYLGPIPRSTVDYIRGVNSSYTVRNLLVRGLIDRERMSEKGHLFHYRVSFAFLQHLGLGRIEELPDYIKYKDTLKQYEENQLTAEQVMPDIQPPDKVETIEPIEPTSTT